MMQLDTKKISPGWIKVLFAVLVFSFATYQAVTISTDTNQKQDRQLNYLQGAYKDQNLESALTKQRLELMEKDLKEFKEKMDAQSIRFEQASIENNKILTQIQTAVSKLDATMQIVVQEKLKGR
jgi:septal ring factor EnvC (AmiA/AmiB activator)